MRASVDHFPTVPTTTKADRQTTALAKLPLSSSELPRRAKRSGVEVQGSDGDEVGASSTPLGDLPEDAATRHLGNW